MRINLFGRTEAVATVVGRLREDVAHQLSGQWPHEHVPQQAQTTFQDQRGNSKPTAQQVQPHRFPSHAQQLLRRRHVGQLDRSRHGHIHDQKSDSQKRSCATIECYYNLII